MRREMHVPLVLTVAAAVLVIVAVAPGLMRGPVGWSQEDAGKPTESGTRTPPSEFALPLKGEAAQFTEARRKMIQRDLAGRDIKDETVLRAMGKIPRHEFVPDEIRDTAYADHPFPIGHRQTISQPYIVALMTQLVGAKQGMRALDIGTGSGYQAAVLGEICKEVYSIEIVEPLAKEAKKRLADLGYKNITVRHGDGYQGWPDKAPFDVIIVAAAPDHVPQPLIDQLAPGGKLVIPVGQWYQELLLIERDKDGKVHRRRGIGVRFVPMTGEAQKRK
jgi:protein-L-isoaspartate(D-aspartate) O-methyltransferase